jgi:hypothetical protein
MKKENLELPQKILFSGTGSKTLAIIDSEERSSNLRKISERIFEKVYEGVKFSSTDTKLEIIQERTMPKEITCKGGLYSNDELVDISPNDIMKIHHCIKDIETLYPKDLANDSFMNEIINHVKEFNDFFVGLNAEINFNDHFGVSPNSLSIFKSKMNQELREYLESSKASMRYTDDEALKETLFFYPVAGTISQLSKELSQLNPLT